jgi:hypothetical protein
MFPCFAVPFSGIGGRKALPSSLGQAHKNEKKREMTRFNLTKKVVAHKFSDCRRVEPMKTPPSTNTPADPGPVTMRASAGKKQIPGI